jgi:hypothetical protein
MAKTTTSAVLRFEGCMLRIDQFLLLFLVFWGWQIQAQPKSKPAGPLTAAQKEAMKLHEDTLGILSYAIVNDSIEQERFAACRQVITGLVRALKTENSFSYPFERLKSMSILYPPDSSFRVFTWQLFVNDSTYRYYGAIQKNTKELTLFPLIDRSDEMDYPKPTHEVLAADRWYGALYYNILQFDTKQGRKYLLLGYDAFEFFQKRKIVDVLGFNEEGKPEFGAPVFEREKRDPKGPEMRFIIEYSSEATVKCNWDEVYGMILMEHLIPMGSPFGRGVTYVPDGSYDGLKLEKGRWKYIAKVFNDFQTEPPTIEQPTEKDKANDVFGREKGSKNKKPKKEKPRS